MQLALPKKEKLRLPEGWKDKKRIAQLAAVGAAAFLLSQCRALGTISPFAVSFACVVPYSCVWSAVLGGVLGVFLVQPWQTALKLSCAFVLAALFRLLIETRFRSLKKTFVFPLLACSAVLISALGFLAFSPFDFSALLLALTEALLAFFAAAFFFRALHSPVQKVACPPACRKGHSGRYQCCCFEGYGGKITE